MTHRATIYGDGHLASLKGLGGGELGDVSRGHLARYNMVEEELLHLLFYSRLISTLGEHLGLGGREGERGGLSHGHHRDNGQQTDRQTDTRLGYLGH